MTTPTEPPAARLPSRRMAIGIAAGVVGAGAALAWDRGAAIEPGAGRGDTVASTSRFPDDIDVAVIGGGVIGACCALSLAERGLRVAVFEKGVVAGEASGRAVGWIDSLYLDGVRSDLVLRAKTLWPGMDARIGGDAGYRRTGILSLLRSDEDRDRAAEWMGSVRAQAGLNPRLVPAAEAAASAGATPGDIAGGLFQPSDGIVEPRRATAAIIAGAIRRGATVHQQCAVRGIDRAAGRVCGIHTERGYVRTGSVVLAGGAWSSLFCANLGIDLPQLRAFVTAASVAPFAGGPRVTGDIGPAMWRNEADGGYTVGLLDGLVPVGRDTLRHGWRFLPAARHMWNEVRPAIGRETFRTFAEPTRWRDDAPSPFEAVRVLQPVSRRRPIARALADLSATLPAFRQATIRDIWAGALVTTPDNLPIVSVVDAIPGLVIATGFYTGLTMAPAVGEAAADLVGGTVPATDLRPYRLSRFTDGTASPFHP